MKRLKRSVTKKIVSDDLDDEERFRAVMDHFWSKACIELRGTLSKEEEKTAPANAASQPKERDLRTWQKLS